MKPALIALAAAVALLVAHILRDRATDARLALLDDSEAVGKYVPMAAWLPSASAATAATATRTDAVVHVLRMARQAEHGRT